MDVLITSSLIASFLAGVAALFAPCCITVLLPVYLASIFREKRAVFFMTFVFFLGLLTIFLPLGLGFGGLGQLLTRYHTVFFVVGSLIMFTLGALILLGKHIAVPVRLPHTRIEHAGSVYLLGIFSGIATVCCAPVLAGALALSMFPGSVLWGGLYAVVYVLGMVIPLFAISFFVDETRVMQKLKFFRKAFSYSLGSRVVRLRAADLLSGVTFLVMGALTLIVAITNPTGSSMLKTSTLQTAVNITASQISDALSSTVVAIPSWLWLVFIGVVVAGITLYAWKRSSKSSVNNGKEVNV